MLGPFLSHYHGSFGNQRTHPYLEEEVSEYPGMMQHVPLGSVCMDTQCSWSKGDQPCLSKKKTIIYRRFPINQKPVDISSPKGKKTESIKEICFQNLEIRPKNNYVLSVSYWNII